MATPTEVQSISTNAECFACASEKTLLAMIAFELWLEAHPGGTMTAADVQTLTDQSSCIACGMSHKMIMAAIVQLLFAGGGGGGGLAFSTGHGSPEGVKTGSPGDTYWDLDTDFEYTKVTGSATNTGWLVH